MGRKKETRGRPQCPRPSERNWRVEGFGMAVAELDDSRVIAAAIVPNGPADLAGIAAGAEILSWGGEPVKAVIRQIDVELQYAFDPLRGY